MSIKNMMVILLAMGLMVAACQPVESDLADSSQKPGDFSFDFRWNVGALPPPYHYSYEILVAADGNGQFIYQEGYEGEDAKEPVVSDFTLSQEQLIQLYEMMLQNDLLRVKWEEGEPLLGAPSSAMRITAAGKEHGVPSDATMKDEDRKAVTGVYDFLRTLLPQSIWDDLAIRREQADSAVDSPST